MANSFFLTIFITLFIKIALDHKAEGEKGFDPTEGFDPLPLNQSNFQIQRPYDIPEDQRYSFIDGVHKLWVFKTDKPHSPESHTKPRTEIRILVSIYSAVYTNLFMCIYKLHHMYIYTLDKI